MVGGGYVSALAECSFNPGEDASAVAFALNGGVASAAELTGCAVSSGAGWEEAGAVFDAVAVCAGASDASDSRKYHAPLAAATIRPAAMAIQIPLPLPRGVAAGGALSPRRELPHSGDDFVRLLAPASFFTAPLPSSAPP